MEKSHYRLAMLIAPYDPYKDVFDIFIKQFHKYWPDCPYPLVVSNMYFQFSAPNTIVINCGDMKYPGDRNRKGREAVEADYYLFLEEDRIIMDKVNTSDIESIINFMDKENVDRFRYCASKSKKRDSDIFDGYEHFFHVRSQEPYGISGSNLIVSKKWLDNHDRESETVSDPYKAEAEIVRKTSISNDLWVDNFATDNRNVLNLLHCVDKQKWILSSRNKLVRAGYGDFVGYRNTQSIREFLWFSIRCLGNYIPLRFRYPMKKVLKRLGFKFTIDY